LIKLRNYQVLTLIGAALGILTTIGYFMLTGALDAVSDSFNESPYMSEESRRQYQENQNTMNYIYTAVPFSILLLIIAIIVAFVATKPRKQTKLAGIVLILISIGTLIATSWIGILPFALLLPAGILAIRFKLNEPQPEPTYTSSGALSRK
jgi:uncharacterized membrane protein